VIGGPQVNQTFTRLGHRLSTNISTLSVPAERPPLASIPELDAVFAYVYVSTCLDLDRAGLSPCRRLAPAQHYSCVKSSTIRESFSQTSCPLLTDNPSSLSAPITERSGLFYKIIDSSSLTCFYVCVEIDAMAPTAYQVKKKTLAYNPNIASARCLLAPSHWCKAGVAGSTKRKPSGKSCYQLPYVLISSSSAPYPLSSCLVILGTPL